MDACAFDICGTGGAAGGAGDCAACVMFAAVDGVDDEGDERLVDCPDAVGRFGAADCGGCAPGGVMMFGFMAGVPRAWPCSSSAR